MEKINRLHGVAVKRADELCLGDLMLVIPWFFPSGKLFRRPSIEPVRSLELIGDDVTINTTTTTSMNNSVLVLTKDDGTPMRWEDTDLRTREEEWAAYYNA